MHRSQLITLAARLYNVMCLQSLLAFAVLVLPPSIAREAFRTELGESQVWELVTQQLTGIRGPPPFEIQLELSNSVIEQPTQDTGFPDWRGMYRLTRQEWGTHHLYACYLRGRAKLSQFSRIDMMWVP
eukprot:TRINITY_DN97954_c0_g1_i1.p1 TRINITY_DN97954_c0_g1~~TRINITY_DN97954_c0_g1_i1.p1  ORF type:complete len:128 (-),score=12.58 TRINITY_DN97954_c0_g1_i1:382-765(-)